MRAGVRESPLSFGDMGLSDSCSSGAFSHSTILVIFAQLAVFLSYCSLQNVVE